MSDGNMFGLVTSLVEKDLELENRMLGPVAMLVEEDRLLQRHLMKKG